MSYQEKEESSAGGSPVLLYLFTQGSTTWRYCSISATISRLGQSWFPAPLVPGKFGMTGEIPKDGWSCQLPLDNSLARTFLGEAPDGATTVTVYRTHYDDVDQETRVYWKGIVSQHRIAGNVVTLECESVFSRLKQPGLGPTYQAVCRHEIYSDQCGVNAEDYAESGTAVAVSGNVVTVTEAAGMDDLTWGRIKAPDGQIRMITAHSGSALTLLWPIKSLTTAISQTPGGVAVTLYAGCDHSFATCRDKFDMAGNFGGFLGFPKSNPMNTPATIVE